MEIPASRRRPLAFLLRVQRTDGRLRGEVVAVGSGAVRLFDSLIDAMTFVEAQIDQAVRDDRREPAD